MIVIPARMQRAVRVEPEFPLDSANPEQREVLIVVSRRRAIKSRFRVGGGFQAGRLLALGSRLTQRRQIRQEAAALDREDIDAFLSAMGRSVGPPSPRRSARRW